MKQTNTVKEAEVRLAAAKEELKKLTGFRRHNSTKEDNEKYRKAEEEVRKATEIVEEAKAKAKASPTPPPPPSTASASPPAAPPPPSTASASPSFKHPPQINDVDAVLRGMTDMSKGSKQAIQTAVGHLNDISRKRTQRHTIRREIRSVSKDIQVIKRDINRNGGSKDLKVALAELRSLKKKLTIKEAKFLKGIKDLKKDFKHHLDDENNRSIKGTIFKKGTIKSDKTSRHDLLFALKTLRRQKCTTKKQIEDRNALLAQMNRSLRCVDIPRRPLTQSKYANLHAFVRNKRNSQPVKRKASSKHSSRSSVTGYVIDPSDRRGKKTIKRKVDTSNLSQKDVNELLDEFAKKPGCTVTRWYEGNKLKYKIDSPHPNRHCTEFLNSLQKLNDEKKKSKKARIDLNKKKKATMGVNQTTHTKGQIVDSSPTSSLTASPLKNAAYRESKPIVSTATDSLSAQSKKDQLDTAESDLKDLIALKDAMRKEHDSLAPDTHGSFKHEENKAELAKVESDIDQLQKKIKTLKEGLTPDEKLSYDLEHTGSKEKLSNLYKLLDKQKKLESLTNKQNLAYLAHVHNRSTQADIARQERQYENQSKALNEEIKSLKTKLTQKERNLYKALINVDRAERANEEAESAMTKATAALERATNNYKPEEHEQNKKNLKELKTKLKIQIGLLQTLQKPSLKTLQTKAKKLDLKKRKIEQSIKQAEQEQRSIQERKDAQMPKQRLALEKRLTELNKTLTKYKTTNKQIERELEVVMGRIEVRPKTVKDQREVITNLFQQRNTAREELKKSKTAKQAFKKAGGDLKKATTAAKNTGTQLEKAQKKEKTLKQPQQSRRRFSFSLPWRNNPSIKETAKKELIDRRSQKYDPSAELSLTTH